MITIIGTGHVFDVSSNLNFLFDKKKPDLICVELDRDRYDILSMRNSDSKKFMKLRKNVPLIYLLFMRFQEKTAKKYGVNPGDEMLAAIRYAQVNKLPYEFIDTNTGGPSGGMMQSLYIYNQLSEFDISHGLKIGGTGTIRIDGTVGAIGGIEQKIYTSAMNNIDIFFVPFASNNYEDALEVYNTLNTDMILVGVDTFEDALNYLLNYEDGESND